MEGDTFHFKLIDLPANSARPVLASFPQNIPDRKDDTSFEMLKKRKITTLKSLDSIIPMSGKHKPQLDTSKYMLGFIDADKKRVNLVDIEHMFTINRYLQNDQTEDIAGLNTNVEGLDHREMIVQEIGTKKGKKIFQQMKNKVIKEDAIFSAVEIKEMMAQKAEEIQNEIDKTDTTHFQKEFERKKEILPEFNISAKSASKIYNLDSLMPPHDIKGIKPEFADNDKFMVDFCKSLRSTNNWASLTEDQLNHKKVLLVYLNCLILFYKLRKIDMPVQEVAAGQRIPQEVAKGIVDRFYEPLKKESGGVTFTRSKKQDTKLACYIVVASLVANGFKIDLDALTQALKLDAPRMAMIAKECGCSITVDRKDKHQATLKKLKIESVDKYQKK